MIKIIDKSKCSGCYACANICPKQCINMEIDNEGFWYPEVDENECVNCGLCEKSCPVVQNKIIENTPKAYAAINKNEEVRLDSSSGGVFTLFAQEIIKQNGVVFGACFDENFNVIHDYVDKIENLSKIRGSKYTQSKIGDTYQLVKEFLEKGKLILFTGTPCQISGLKSFLGKEYDNLYCQDLICHGVPSPKVWQNYVAYREKCAVSPASKINFRRKNEGWKQYSVSFLFNNGTEYKQTLDKDLFMTAFLKNTCLRPSCYDCSFKKLNRESDFTLADFWGIDNIMPEMDDDKGTSLLIVNSDKGNALFEKIKSDMVFKKTNLMQAVMCNSAMLKSVNKNPKGELFLSNIDNFSFDKLVEKYCTDSLLIRAKKKIRAILSKVKHKIFK